MPQPRLTEVAYLKRLLKKAGITPKRTSGQNFLICDEVLEATVTALDESVKQVTELGAGLGTLTQALVEAGFRVRAIERDRHLTPLLKKSVSKKQVERLEVAEADLKEADWAHDAAYQLVGNIPYNLSGYILRKMTQLEPAPERAVLLVQKEVGERVCATPPDMSLVGLAVQLWGKPVKLLNVPASCFWPEPKVDSQLIAIEPHFAEASRGRQSTNEQILTIAKVFFQAKRKQMGGVVRRQGWDEEALKQARIDPLLRPQEITVEQWRALAGIL